MVLLHRLDCEPIQEGHTPTEESARRFVLHRHRDEAGEHLDLRLEQEGYLMGFRVDGPRLEGAQWASAKAPHPLHWLTQDGTAIREDEGCYHWESGDANQGILVLQGQSGALRIHVDAAAQIPETILAGMREVSERLGVSIGALAALVEDGATARDRALTRFCGLGRELDGDTFDEKLWRNTLSGERLAVIQQYLHGLEVRFDKKYPPTPVSIPAPLDHQETQTHTGRAMEILRT